MTAVIARIETLTQEPGYIYTLALILLRDVFLIPEMMADINPREHLNIQELTLLIGLALKYPLDFTVPSEERLGSAIREYLYLV